MATEEELPYELLHYDARRIDSMDYNTIVYNCNIGVPLALDIWDKNIPICNKKSSQGMKATGNYNTSSCMISFYNNKMEEKDKRRSSSTVATHT